MICNPHGAGAVRSLLGRDFTLPPLISNHRTQMPQPAQGWHRDAGAQYGPEVQNLQVFYYPEACTREMGPTEVLPGSHFLFALSPYLTQYGSVRGSVYTETPAGTIFITHYAIWHRRSASTASGTRNLLKYNYWRTAPPERDWRIEPDFDFATADYALAGPRFREQFRDTYDAAEMFFWLCGKADEFQLMGGQGWPVPGTRNDKPFGFPGTVTGKRFF